MDCLICFKVFNKEVEYRTDPPPNSEMCMDIICKLFNILPSHPNIRRIFEDPLICRGCHGKLDVVDKVFKSAKYDISEILAAGVKAVSETENRMSKSSRDRVALVRSIKIGFGRAETTPEMDAQIGDIIADSSGTNNIGERLEDRVYLRAILEEDSNAMEEEEAEPIQIDQYSSQNVPANNVRPGPSRPPILSRNGVDKEARICLKPLEIVPGVTSFKVHRVGESGTNYALKIREKELVNQEGESEEEESEDEELKCRFCSKILSSKSNLQTHLALHGQPPFKCQHCSRQFNQKKNLINHLGNKIPHKCFICNKTFPTPGCLKQHEWKVHQRGYYAKNQVKKNFMKLKDGRFKCNRCAKIVKIPIAHLMVHRPPKYPCLLEGCGKMFIFPGSRTNHMKIDHEGLRYKCGLVGCGKLFRSKYPLLVHAKVHSFKNKAKNSRKVK